MGRNASRHAAHARVSLRTIPATVGRPIVTTRFVGTHFVGTLFVGTLCVGTLFVGTLFVGTLSACGRYGPPKRPIAPAALTRMETAAKTAAPPVALAATIRSTSDPKRNPRRESEE